MKSMYEQYYQEPKYRPSYVCDPRVAAGLHGRKTGRDPNSSLKNGPCQRRKSPKRPSVMILTGFEETAHGTRGKQ